MRRVALDKRVSATTRAHGAGVVGGLVIYDSISTIVAAAAADTAAAAAVDGVVVIVVVGEDDQHHRS